MDDPGVHPSQHVDRHAAKQSRDQSHQRAEAKAEDTRGRMRGRDGRDRGGPVFGIAHGTDRQDVVLQQLEDDPQLAGRGDVLCGDVHAAGSKPAQLRRLVVRQIHKAQPLFAAGAMVHATHVEPLQLRRPPGERHGGVDIPHEQDPDARVGLPIRQHVRGLLDGREYHFDLRRHTHPVEILLPVAAADLVIDEHDERDVERLSPANHDLPMDQAVIDAVQRQGHGRVTWIALPPASTARRAASAGEISRLNTKSSSMARLTPVTTAMAAPPCVAYRAELVKHEPPGRSTKSTAGPPPAASRSRSPSSAVPQPSLEIGVSAPSMPVIAVTASTIAFATAACDTMTPRSSLIIFLEVTLHPALLPHAPNQALVARVRRVHTAVAQQVSHRDDFADHGQILPRIERHCHEWQLDIEQLRALLIEARAVVFPRVVPVLELYHDLDALLLADGTNAEQCINVDQANTADLHIVPGNLVAATDQDVVAPPGDVHDIVRDQPMPTLDEIEHAFALADPGDRKSTRLNSSHM